MSNKTVVFDGWTGPGVFQNGFTVKNLKTVPQGQEGTQNAPRLILGDNLIGQDLGLAGPAHLWEGLGVPRTNVGSVGLALPGAVSRVGPRCGLELEEEVVWWLGGP